MKYKSDAGTPLRSKAGREVLKVQTNKGLVPFSVKKKNIELKKGGSLRGVKAKSR